MDKTDINLMRDEIVAMVSSKIMSEVLRIIASMDARVMDIESSVANLTQRVNEIQSRFDEKRGASGRVSIDGKWLLWESGVDDPNEAIDGTFKNLCTNPSKRYIKVNKRTMTATEEAGPLPLTGEADCLWFDKEEHQGDIYA